MFSCIIEDFYESSRLTSTGYPCVSNLERIGNQNNHDDFSESDNSLAFWIHQALIIGKPLLAVIGRARSISRIQFRIPFQSSYLVVRTGARSGSIMALTWLWGHVDRNPTDPDLSSRELARQPLVVVIGGRAKFSVSIPIGCPCSQPGWERLPLHRLSICADTTIK